MRVSLLVLLLPVFVLFALFAFFWRSKSARAARVAEPSCGGCGYCVRGLETFTCPECGGDLRELGIITPGSIKPMSRGMRLLLWTIAIPIPAYIVGHVIADRFGPWETSATRQRVVFSHLLGVGGTVRIVQSGTRVDWGRRSRSTTSAPAPTHMTLTLESRNSPNVLNVKLLDDAPLDTQIIGDWLRAHNFSGEDVDEAAGYVRDAIDDMDRASPGTFLQFKSPDNGQQRAIAHPVNMPMLITRPASVTPHVPYAFAGLVWVAGLPVVLRRPRAVQSARHANQA